MAVDRRLKVLAAARAGAGAPKPKRARPNDGAVGGGGGEVTSGIATVEKEKQVSSRPAAVAPLAASRRAADGERGAGAGGGGDGGLPRPRLQRVLPPSQALNLPVDQQEVAKLRHKLAKSKAACLLQDQKVAFLEGLVKAQQDLLKAQQDHWVSLWHQQQEAIHSAADSLYTCPATTFGLPSSSTTTSTSTWTTGVDINAARVLHIQQGRVDPLTNDD
ncbi:hypothetical protein U9M48_041990 [Paspalum notatum var. saurae]|uniref:Uncharacterized protein n=1 Tax=Paspalum notatum var. saurae TaxID=547442 RepID=A0AAQ3UU77_PASNO